MNEWIDAFNFWVQGIITGAVLGAFVSTVPLLFKRLY